MRRSAILVFGTLLLMIGVACSSSSGEAGAGSDCVSTACKLATVDAGTYVAPDDSVVDAYQAALDGLSPYCQEGESSLGDFAAKAQELLANGGQSETLLEVLQHVRQSIPNKMPSTKCSDLFAAYVVLRGGTVS